MAGHPASATQPTSSPRALRRNDNNRPDALTAPMTRPPSTSSSDTWCGAVREDRVRSATKAKTRSSSLKTKRKSKPQKRSKCYTPSRAEKRYRTSARDRSIIHQIDVVLSSTTPEDPIPTPTSVLNTSNLRRQHSYDPIQRFYDSKDDETIYKLAFGGDKALQDRQQYPFGYGVEKSLIPHEQDALISAMAGTRIGGDTLRYP